MTCEHRKLPAQNLKWLTEGCYGREGWAQERRDHEVYFVSTVVKDFGDKAERVVE